MSKFLSYGDMIMISFVSTTNGQKNVVYSNGFLENEVFLKDYLHIFETDFRNAIFQLYPSISNEISTESRNLSKILIGDHFHKMWSNHLDEISNKYLGRPILYGDHIQLLHVESKSFMYVIDNSTKIFKNSSMSLNSNLNTIKSINNNNNNINGYKMQLQQEIDNNNYFQILSVSNYSQIGAKVFYDSKFYLKSYCNNQLLSFSKSLENNLNLMEKETLYMNSPIVNDNNNNNNNNNSVPEENLNIKNLKHSRNAIKHLSDVPINIEKQGKIGEINFTSESSMISFMLYSTFKLYQQYETEKIIKNGDYVKIYDQRFINENMSFHRYYILPKKTNKYPSEYTLTMIYNNDNKDDNSINNNDYEFLNPSLSFHSIYQVIESTLINEEIKPVILLNRKPFDQLDFNSMKSPKYLLRHIATSHFVKNSNTTTNKNLDTVNIKSIDNAKLCPIEWLPKAQIFKNLEDLSINIISSKPLDQEKISMAEDHSFLLGTFKLLRTMSLNQQRERSQKSLQSSFIEMNYLSQSNVHNQNNQSKLNEEDDQKEIVLSKNDVDEYTQYELKWKIESNMTECLKFKIVSSEEMYVVNYLKSFSHIVNYHNHNYNKFIKKQGNQNLENYHVNMISELDENITKILAFLIDQKNYDIGFQYGKFDVSREKQSIIKELKIVDQINQILFSICGCYAIFTKTDQFISFTRKFCQFLCLIITENIQNTIYLSKFLKFYLKPALLNQMVPVIYEVINASEYGSLGFITEILNTFIFDSSLSFFQIGTELSISIIRVIISAAKYKTFCVSLQRYQEFWHNSTIEKIFPKLKLSSSSSNNEKMASININSNNEKILNEKSINDVEVYLDNKHICNLSDLSYKEFPSGNLIYDYLIYTFELIVVLSKSLPNFLRLYSSISYMIPYDICLSVIDITNKLNYQNEEELLFNSSYKLNHLILELIIHFHIKYITLKRVIWPNKLIRMMINDNHISNNTSNNIDNTNTKSKNNNGEKEKIQDSDYNAKTIGSSKENESKQGYDAENECIVPDVPKYIQEILLSDNSAIISEDDKNFNKVDIEEKSKMMKIFNVFYRKLKNILRDNIIENKKVLDNNILLNIQNLLQLLNLFLKNNIISFKTKDEHLALYKDIFSLVDHLLQNKLINNNYYENHNNVTINNKNNSNKNILISTKRLINLSQQYRSNNNNIYNIYFNDKIKEREYKLQLPRLLHEILININHSIEDFFTIDFLYYTQIKADKLSIICNKDDQFNKSINKTNDKDIRTNISISKMPMNPNNAIDDAINNINSNNASDIDKNIINNNSNQKDNFIKYDAKFDRINCIDIFENETILEDFILEWDNKLHEYGLSMMELIDEELRFVLMEGFQLSTLKNLQSLMSRFHIIVTKMKDYVIIENMEEYFKVICLMKCSFSLQLIIEELIHHHDETNMNHGGYNFDQITIELGNILKILNIPISMNTKQNNEDNFNGNSNSFYENLIFKNDYCLINSDSKMNKFQDVIRILKIHEILMEILDFHINLNIGKYNISYEKNLQNVFQIIQILLFFVTNHSKNSNLIYKLITTVYFHDIYGKGDYKPELIIYLQMIISRIFQHISDAPNQQNEQLRIFDIFFKSFFSQALKMFSDESIPESILPQINLDISEMETSFTTNKSILNKTELKNLYGLEIDYNSKSDDIKKIKQMELDKEDSTKMYKNKSKFIPKMSSSSSIFSPSKQQLQQTPIITLKYKEELIKITKIIYVSFKNLNDMLNFVHTPILQIIFANLSKLFTISFCILDNFLLDKSNSINRIIADDISNNRPKLMLNMLSETERNYWFRYFGQFITTILNLQNAKNLIMNLLSKNKITIQTIILLISKLNLRMPIDLRQALFRLGHFIYINSFNNDNNNMDIGNNIKSNQSIINEKDRIVFIYLNLIEFELFFTSIKKDNLNEVLKNQGNINNNNNNNRLINDINNIMRNSLKELRQNLIQIDIFREYSTFYTDFTLNIQAFLNLLENDKSTNEYIKQNHINIKNHIKSTILPFFKNLLKYDVFICCLSFETSRSLSTSNGTLLFHNTDIFNIDNTNTRLSFASGMNKKIILDFILDYINNLCQIFKIFNDEDTVNYIRNNIHQEIKNNNFGKYEQNKFIEHFSHSDAISYLINSSDESKNKLYTLYELFIKAIEKYFKNKSKAYSSIDYGVKILVQILEKHKEERILYESLLKFLRKHDEICFSNTNKRFLYMILYEIIKNKIQSIQNMGEKFEYISTHIKIIQRQLLKNNLTSFIFQGLMTFPDTDLELILELAIKYLFGGCYEIQQSFYEQFGLDQENRVMLRLYGVLKKCLEEIVNQEKIRIKTNYMLYKPQKEINEEHLNKKSIIESEHTLVVTILYFIQLLCENHNNKFQHFFHDQSHHHNKISTLSVNFPIELCNFFKSIIKICNYNTFSIGKQLLCTISEIIQGNRRSIIKEICIKTNIIDDILDFLNKYKTGTDVELLRFNINLDYLESLRYEAITLLLSILESSDYETKLNIGEQIDCKKLLIITENLLRNFFKSKGITSLKKENIFKKLNDKDFAKKSGFIDGLNMLIVIKILEEYSYEFAKKIQDSLKNLDNEIKNNFIQYQDKISDIFLSSIEIVDQEKNLRKIYFIKYVSCFFLSKKIKANIIDKIVRTNYFSKITEFFGYTDEVLYQIYHEHKAYLMQKTTSLNNLNKTFKKSNHALAFILNLLLLLYFDNNDLTIIIEDTYHNWDSTFYFFLNCFQLASSLLIFITWFWTNERRFLLKAKWSEFTKSNANIYDPITLVEEERWQLRPETMTENDFEKILLLKGPSSEEFKFNKKKAFQYTKIWYLFLSKNFYFYLSSKAIITNMIYVVSCALSLTVHPVFCSWQLINTLAESKMMQSVFNSFYKNGAELGMTFLFGLIIIFIYSLVGFFFLRDTFVIVSYENVCTTVWHCFISVIDFGLRSGGGIGEVLKKESYINGNSDIYTYRWIYDISFFVLIIIIMLRLIFGIVIDTFSNIREEKLRNTEDQVTKCFICGIESGLLERIGNGFQQHIRYEHYMWDYMFYILYLKIKGVIDLSEIEAYIYKCYKNKNYSWIPYSRALCMKQDDRSENIEQDLMSINAQNLEKKANELNSKVEDIFKIIQRNKNIVPSQSSLDNTIQNSF